MKQHTRIIPWVNGPSEPYTEGERHRTVNLRLPRQSFSITCPTQAHAYRLKGRLISAFQGLTDDPGEAEARLHEQAMIAAHGTHGQD